MERKYFGDAPEYYGMVINDDGSIFVGNFKKNMDLGKTFYTGIEINEAEKTIHIGIFCKEPKEWYGRGIFDMSENIISGFMFPDGDITGISTSKIDGTATTGRFDENIVWKEEDDKAQKFSDEAWENIEEIISAAEKGRDAARPNIYYESDDEEIEKILWESKENKDKAKEAITTIDRAIERAKEILATYGPGKEENSTTTTALEYDDESGPSM